jgi:hypothetical protein
VQATPVRKPSRPDVAAPLGVTLDVVYPIAEFQRRLNVGRHFLRAARRAGLKVSRFGNRSFISGKDFAAFLELQVSDHDA